MLNCVIIDDEEFSIESLRKYINLVPRLRIEGVYTNPQMALQDLINGPQLDVLFLDVDMPLISGIELAKALRNKTRKLIFTTSHSKYAFDAFEVEADAFLLKPFSFGKFSLTITKLFPVDQVPEVQNISGDEYFFVKNKEEGLRIVKVMYSEVIAFESFHNYVMIHLVSNKPITVYLTIKDILDLVKGRENFKQFHRAFVISTENISYIENSNVKMSNNLAFTVGERFKSLFSEYLDNRLITTSRKR